jgi:hypothetical protein
MSALQSYASKQIGVRRAKETRLAWHLHNVHHDAACLQEVFVVQQCVLYGTWQHPNHRRVLGCNAVYKHICYRMKLYFSEDFGSIAGAHCVTALSWSQ